jgi:hypothetical protein
MGAAMLAAGLLAGPAAAASNLVANGSFDDPAHGLAGWKYRYDPAEDKNVGWYTNNHNNVKVVEEDGPQRKVLALWGDYAILQVPGQGTKVDSDPLPFVPQGRYRFTVRARSTGPDCRIMVEGYRWAPGIKPHPRPNLNELRRCYRFSQVYFGGQKAGAFGGVGRRWETVTMNLPERTGSKLQGEMLDATAFLAVHLIAIGGNEGTLYVDDVRLERVK